MDKISAKEIVNILKDKHIDDVFCDECKIGPTHTGPTTRRFDCWAMKKSWAHPCYIGYEIKVNKSDFRNDQKWVEYLQYCNEFSFVAPKGLISKLEVPEEAGLMEVIANRKIITRKKAPHRKIEHPISLLHYILMARAKVGDHYYLKEDPFDFWKAYVEERREKSEIGRHASKKVSEYLTEKVYKVESKQKILEKEIENLQIVKDWLDEHKIDTSRSWSIENNLDEYLEKIETGMSKDLRFKIKEALRVLEKLNKAINVEPTILECDE